MKSRASFFDKTVFRKDITRFSPAWLLYLILALLISQTALSNAGYVRDVGENARLLMDTLKDFALVSMCYGLLAAHLLFGDIFNSKLCNGLHALPLRRETWFCTHVVSGILMFCLIPNLIVALAVIPYLDGMWYLSFLWVLGMTLEFLFFFGLGAFSAICTGNRVAMTIVFFLLGYLSLLIQWFAVAFFQPLLYGLRLEAPLYLYFSPAEGLTRLHLELFRFDLSPLKTSPNGMMVYEYTYQGLGQHWWYPVAMAGTGIALLAAAMLLYRRRKLECAGDMMAFRPLKFVFLVVYTLTIGALSHVLTDGNWVFITVGLLLGVFSGLMMLDRTVKILHKKNFLKMGLILGTLGLAMLTVWLDPFGIVEWTPKADQVASISLNHCDSVLREDLVIEDPAQIQRLIEIHEQLISKQIDPAVDGHIQEGDLMIVNQSTATNSVQITYTMKDGRKISRYYYYKIYTPIGQELDRYFSMPEFVLGYTDWQTFLDQVKDVRVNNCPIPEEFHEALLEAVKADCEAGTMSQNELAHLHNADASRQYYLEIALDTGDIVSSSMNIDIFMNSKNTMAWLEAHQNLLDNTNG